MPHFVHHSSISRTPNKAHKARVTHPVILQQIPACDHPASAPCFMMLLLPLTALSTQKHCPAAFLPGLYPLLPLSPARLRAGTCSLQSCHPAWSSCRVGVIWLGEGIGGGLREGTQRQCRESQPMDTCRCKECPPICYNVTPPHPLAGLPCPSNRGTWWQRLLHLATQHSVSALSLPSRFALSLVITLHPFFAWSFPCTLSLPGCYPALALRPVIYSSLVLA